MITRPRLEHGQAVDAVPSFSQTPNEYRAPERVIDGPNDNANQPECDVRSASGHRQSRRVTQPILSRTLSDVTPERVNWFWDGYIAFGKLTLVEGDPGCGKSTFTMACAACVSAGRAMPCGTQLSPADVLLVSYEDGEADTIRPRAEAAGADLARVHVIRGIGHDQPIVIPEHVAALQAEIERRRARLVVIDPLGAALSGGIDSHKDTDVRRALAPLARLAETTGAAIVVVRHLAKGARGSAVLAGSGSVGISAAARAVLTVGVPRHATDSHERLLAVAKNNLAIRASSVRFRIEAAELASGVLASRIRWLGKSSESADELIAARCPDQAPSALMHATNFLRDALASGLRKASEVQEEARAHGISPSTLARARVSLGVIQKRDGFGPGGVSVWSLPNHSAPASIPGPYFPSTTPQLAEKYQANEMNEHDRRATKLNGVPT